jgi:tRNA threonylcarbamoyladenosine biosynthesis protein TsaE
MSGNHLSLSFPDAESTALHAKLLGQNLRPGDVVLLSGDVGAGKTHFARSLIQSLLTVAEDVPSPTFTLVQTYDTPKGEVWHSDLYRLTSTYETEELGLAEAFDQAICLIEWPDRLGSLTPLHALHLDLADGADENARTATLRWSDNKWNGKLTAWQTT